MSSERTAGLPRIVDVLRTLVGADEPGPSAAAPSRPDAGAPPAPEPDEQAAWYETAARSVESALERWRAAAPVLRLLGGMQSDTIARPGVRCVLEAVAPIGNRDPSRLRFVVADGAPATPTVDASGVARAPVTVPPRPGLYPVVFEGPSSKTQRRAVLQVVDDKPLVLVDARLLLEKSSGGEAVRLDALNASVAYVYIGAGDRRAAIRDAAAAAGGAEGAVLAFDADLAGIEYLGIDAADLLFPFVVRSLRARGLPVVGVVGGPEGLGVDGVEAWRGGRGSDEPTEPFEPWNDRLRDNAARFVAAYHASDPLTWRLDHATGSRPTRAVDARVELDNRAARRRVLALVDDAERSIRMQVYIMRPSAFAEALVVGLIQAARRGVSVRLLVDALYSDQEVLGRVNALVRSLSAEDNIEVAASNPIPAVRDMDVRRLKNRDHRKLIVADDATAIVSGRNFGDEYYTEITEVPVHDHTNHDRIPWFDAHVELTGPVVDQVAADFDGSWASHGSAAVPSALGADVAGEPGAKRASVVAAAEGDRSTPDAPATESGDPPTPGSVGLACRFVVHEGLGDFHSMSLYEALLDAAEQHVIIVNDFPFVSVLEQAVLRAVARGVRVELLTGNAAARRDDGSLFPAPVHRTLFEHMVKSRFEPLIRSGVVAYEYVTPELANVVARGGRVRPYVHAKIVSVDGAICTIGSANLDATASLWESEANVVVRDGPFTRALEARLRACIERSYRVDLESEYWRRERVERKVVGALWPDALYS